MKKIQSNRIILVLIALLFSSALIASVTSDVVYNYEEALDAASEHSGDAGWISTIKNRFQYCVDAAQKATERGKATVKVKTKKGEKTIQAIHAECTAEVKKAKTKTKGCGFALILLKEEKRGRRWKNTFITAKADLSFRSESCKKMPRKNKYSKFKKYKKKFRKLCRKGKIAPQPLTSGKVGWVRDSRVPPKRHARVRCWIKAKRVW